MTNARNLSRVPNAVTTDSSGNVMIGTTSPGAKFTVAGGIYGAPSTADSGLVIEGASAVPNQQFIVNISKGGGAYQIARITSGNNDLFSWGGVLSSYASVYTLANPEDGPMVFKTNATERMRIDSSGNLQVSNLAGTGNRAVYSTSTGVLTNSSSDRSLKENDAPISQGLDAVLAMRPISYEWIDKDKMGAQREIGFIAQEMQQIVPEVVGSNSDETLSIDYPKLVAVMAKAIQELKAELDATKAEVAALKAIN